MAINYKCTNCEKIHTSVLSAMRCCPEIIENTSWLCTVCGKAYGEEDDALECCPNIAEIHDIDKYLALFDCNEINEKYAVTSSQHQRFYISLKKQGEHRLGAINAVTRLLNFTFIKFKNNMLVFDFSARTKKNEAAILWVFEALKHMLINEEIIFRDVNIEQLYRLDIQCGSNLDRAFRAAKKKPVTVLINMQNDIQKSGFIKIFNAENETVFFEILEH